MIVRSVTNFLPITNPISADEVDCILDHDRRDLFIREVKGEKAKRPRVDGSFKFYRRYIIYILGQGNCSETLNSETVMDRDQWISYRKNLRCAPQKYLDKPPVV